MLDHYLSDFIVRSLLAGCILAVPLALTGCFLMWRRMVFLGDTLSHAAILGVALGLILQVDVHLSVIIVAFLVALVLSRRHQTHLLPLDTWMSILSYGSLALGLIILTFKRGQGIDPDSILFGDILAISIYDLVWIAVIALLAVVIAVKNWRVWLVMTLDEDLALTSGIPVAKQRLLFIAMVAMVIAIGMKMVGALLLPALMVLPVATVAPFSKTPERMVLLSILMILASYFLGFYVSFEADSPTGPTIIVVATILFGLSHLRPWKSVGSL